MVLLTIRSNVQYETPVYRELSAYAKTTLSRLIFESRLRGPPGGGNPQFRRAGFDLPQAVLSAAAAHRPARAFTEPEARLAKNGLHPHGPGRHFNHCVLVRLRASNQPSPPKP